MLPVSALSFGVLALSSQFLAPAAALSGDAQQVYSEWKQSSYYSQAVQVVNTVGGTAAGSFTSTSNTGVSSSASYAGEVSVGSLESNETITVPSSSGSTGSSAAITSSSSSSSGSAAVTTITTSEEQQRFDQALTLIAELQELHPHANFSINTPFVLLTPEEFLAYVNRYAIDPDSSPVKSGTTTSSTAGMFTTDAEGSSSSTNSSVSGELMTSSAASDETVDWQDAGCVTDVKDQGECGACWAFSATAAMESGYCVATGGSLPSLSDQELISCDSDDGNSGCGGGYAAYTMDWIANERSGKMCTLDSYPFASDDGNVPSCSMSSCTEVDIGVTGYESIHEDAGAIEDAVRSQPVSIFLYSGSSAFQYYSGGVLTGANCDKTGSHSGLAVGFGETDDGVLYWRIKNQWGTSWGEDGYVRVERRYSGDSEGACGVELYATYPTFDVSASSVATSDASSATGSTSTAGSSTSAPSVTTATPSVATVSPSVTTAAPTTETPAATKAGLTVVDQSETSASAASGSDSAVQIDAVASSASASDAADSTVQDEAVSPASNSGSADEASSNATTTPVPTSAAASDSAAEDYSIPTPSATTSAPTSVEESDSVAGDASYATTPSSSKRDCAM